MQPAFGTNQPSNADAPTSGARAPDRATYASVVALARAVELHDPGLARRAALRAAVLDHVSEALGLDSAELATVLGGALLAEVAALVTHARPSGDVDVAVAVLGASLLDRVTSCGPLADAVRYQFERWDASGAPGGLAGESIPQAARLVALAHALVGPVEAGGTPHWISRAGRVRSLAGLAFDPRLAQLVTARVAEALPRDPVNGIDDALARLDDLIVGAGEESPIEALTSIGAAIHAADRVDEVLTLIAGHVRRSLGAATVAIGRHDPSEHVIRVVTSVGDLAAATGASGVAHAIDTFPAESAFRAAVVHAYARDSLDHDTVEARYLDTIGAESELAIPLDIDGRHWGVLWARTNAGEHALADRELATLRLAATQITSSVSQAGRVADLEALALRDPLTGLGNRRVLETTLRRIFGRPPVARQDCAVIICDVDGLKFVNDTDGHAAGDAVLADAASALRHSVVDVTGATVCRIGGDEFCIVLDGGGMLLGEPVAARAQKLFARSGANRSMSCGVAVASIGVNAPGELLRAADEAQYLQKRGRRGATDEELIDLVGGSGRRARRDH